MFAINKKIKKMRKKLNLEELSLELPKIESNETRFLLGGSDYDTGVDNPLHELNIPPIDSTPNVEPVNQLDPADLVPYENELPSADLPDIEGTQGQDTDGGIGDVDTTGEGDDDNINDPDPNEENDNDDAADYHNEDSPDNADESIEWSWEDFRYHYYNGDGEAVNLNEMGLRDDITLSQEYLDMKSRIYDQLVEMVRERIANEGLGEGTYDLQNGTNNSYDFTFEIDTFPIGTATIDTFFDGEFTIDENGVISIEGNLNVDFYDYFTDPLDIPNWVDGEWNPADATPFEISDEWVDEILMSNIQP